MKAVAMMVGIVAFAAWNSHAVDKVTCVTEKKEYHQGEEVKIIITNDSNEDTEIPDREYIDGGFAVIEKKDDGGWKAIELLAAANIITSRKLRKNGYHVYVWKTKGHNRSDTLAIPGTYRVRFSIGFQSNEFFVRSDMDSFK